MTNESRALPLAGVKVLDFSRVLAGPWCAMVLADFGAEVIKVEHPARGDDTRDWGLRIGDTETTYFNSVNRSKRSICLDLQTEAGRRLARELAAQADVVLHNFKFGGELMLETGWQGYLQRYGGNIRENIGSTGLPTSVIMAAPTPWTTRAVISISMLPLRPHQSEASVKIPRPTR